MPGSSNSASDQSFVSAASEITMIPTLAASRTSLSAFPSPASLVMCIASYFACARVFGALKEMLASPTGISMSIGSAVATLDTPIS